MAEINIAAFYALLSSSTGRDKVSKLIQYGSRGLGWSFTSVGQKEIGNKMMKLYKGTSSSRKLFRLFKSLDFILKFRKFRETDRTSIPDLLALVSSFFYGFYFLNDHVVWLTSIGVLDRDVTPYKRASSNGWLLGIIFAMLGDSVKLNQLSNSNEAHTEKVRKQIHDTRLKFIKNICDFCVALQSTGNTNRFNDGALGVLGVVSALHGIYTAWPRK
eukprot:TRINITY_DN373_c0_g2_i1.p1 TRINITY_DN373_c0_g2~~TRINITY_DN373_c0_g2_i1.p1  ORF type:complete len:216 (+),score=25.00 TRINITY_DN373_c0_g2_i1:100-747(+)